MLMPLIVELHAIHPTEYTVILSFRCTAEKADDAIDHMRNALVVDIIGWVPNDEYEASQSITCKIGQDA